MVAGLFYKLLNTIILVAGGRFELYSAYPIPVAAVLASLKAT